ncbi:molybdate ABC transporter substrate-binding protein [Ruegeria marina]|nr:molybdate ABC transporter substrate-binding protein [Ruegeria marina]
MADRVTVFAAASLKTALDEAAAGFEAETGHEVVLSFAGSSVLARQIGLGAPADLFVSANEDWMDSLADGGHIVETSRRDLLSNRLVLVGPSGQKPGDMARALAGNTGRVAMALVDAVPAGIYGKAALTELGLWNLVAPRVAQTDNVRAALALVATGTAPLGIVYATDALAEPQVSVIAIFPDDSHPPIRYPAALISGRDTEAARDLLNYLSDTEAQGVFARHGFLPVGD